MPAAAADPEAPAAGPGAEPPRPDPEADPEAGAAARPDVGAVVAEASEAGAAAGLGPGSGDVARVASGAAAGQVRRAGADAASGLGPASEGVARVASGGAAAAGPETGGESAHDGSGSGGDHGAHVLVLEADGRLRPLLARYLRAVGYLVTTARDRDHAARLLDGLAFDLAILDSATPGCGLLARRVREGGGLVILLGGALQGHGDAPAPVLHRPFDPEALVALAAGQLRRPARRPPPRQMLHFGAARYDLDAGVLWRGADRVRLTMTEAALLATLARGPGRPHDRASLLAGLDRGADDPAAGGGTGGGTAGGADGGAKGGGTAGGSGAQLRAVDVQITRLRRKLEPDPARPRFLQTVRGAGYMLVPD